MAVTIAATRPAATTGTRLVGATAAAVTAAVHLWLTPEHTDPDHVAMGHAYIGVLFAVAGLLMAAVALALLAGPFRRLRDEAWWAGAVLSAGMITLLLVSRYTNLLPAGYREPWEPLALVCLAAEVVFLAAFAVSRSDPGGGESWTR